MSKRLNLISSPEPCASKHSGRLAEIALDQLRANDQIVIQTAHSAYVFLVIDPAKHLGMVIGGVFGNYAAEAYLDVLPVGRGASLRAGVRALFYVKSNTGCKRVTTSVITNLIHRRTGSEPPR